MSTEASSLPVLDTLHMRVAFAGLRISRGPEPVYRVFFRICMHNAGDTSIRLRGRKWLLQNAEGETRIVEAAQVFNQYPVLAPGAVFTSSGYQEFTRRPVNIEVRFFGLDQWGAPFISPALIFPRHVLRAPRA